MKFIRVLAAMALFAALFVLAFPVHADCGDGDPLCLLEPPVSREIRTASTRGEAAVTAAESGAITPLDFAVPMPLPRRVEAPSVSAQSEFESTNSIPDFANLSIPMRYQTAGDVSCGVQALGMALDGFKGSAPTSNSILGFLQDQGMMYDFGTGVEELAHAAQNFGYAGSLPFHGWSLDQLMATLAEGKPVVVALGANSEGEPGHFVTMTGVSADGKWISYNDPTLGKKVMSTEEFERLWSLQGSSGVSVAETVPAGASVDYAPLVALAAGLMALVSTTPMVLGRKGIGGMLDPGGATGGSTGNPPYSAPAGYKWKKKIVTKYKTAWVQNGWTYENRTVPRYERQRVQVGTMMVYDKIPKYKTVRVQDGWKTVLERVPQYKTIRYVKYYRTTRQRVKRYRYVRGHRYFTGYSYVTKRTPVYGTKKIFNGYKKVSRRVPNYVDKRVPDGFKVIETEVPKYEWRDVKVGWAIEKVKVPKMVQVKQPDGVDVKWELEKLPAPEPTHETENCSTPQGTHISDDPVLERVPDILEDPLGWFQATLINYGRQNETANEMLVNTLAPAAEWLQSIPNQEVHPVLAAVNNTTLEMIESGIEGWTKAIDNASVLFDYTYNAIRDGRWDDVGLVVTALNNIPGELTDELIQQYDDLPLLAQVGVGFAPGGDVIDLVKEGRNVAKGESVDELVLGLSVFGLIMDLGWGDALIPDPLDGGNAGAAFLKALLKQLDEGPSRDAIEKLIKNPDDWGRVIESVQSIVDHSEDLKVLDDPELFAWLVTKGPETIENVAKYGDEASGVIQALQASERLAELGKHSDEAGDLIDTILDVSVHGSGDRVILGRNPDYIKNAINNDGVWFNTPDGVYSSLGKQRELMEEVNKQFLREQLESGIGRIELIGENIDDVLSNPARSGSFTAMELRFLANEAPNYGYIRVGNAWLLP